ncbi:hypothetical protein JHK82_042965 [Glycine max]|uniref:Uncharacterized protein n=2 Tax=Glycine subgen. Soja TaxID=1462606 RepID=A0A0R0GB38_SOYBN|nr:hypothetical protein JHK82_042965 [Glycine max]KAH1209965.1 hypothetical protein GmHk_15G044360 [Glycine max]RZB65409.1 hypothetical protein D0Y65_041458 [Glycine soja]
MILWGIWNRRNEKLREAKDAQPQISVNNTLQFFNKWCHARHQAGHTLTHHEQHRNERWTKPMAEFLKCNIDIAIFKVINNNGLNYVIRRSSRVTQS